MCCFDRRPQSGVWAARLPQWIATDGRRIRLCTEAILSPIEHTAITARATSWPAPPSCAPTAAWRAEATASTFSTCVTCSPGTSP